MSADNLDKPDKNWIGINQIISNKLVEYFFETHQLEKKKGLGAYEISMKFAKDGVELVSCKNIINKL